MPNQVRRLPQWWMSSLASGVLASILLFHLYLWPVAYLGFAADPQSGIVTVVEANGVAAAAGLQVNDRIVRMYDRPWDQASIYPNTLALATPQIPLTVQRHATQYALLIEQQPPSSTFQFVKILNLALALLCWLTGYVLGVMRRHEFAYHPRLALGWLSCSMVLGWYQVALYGAPYLWLALEWFVITLLMPLMIALHTLFPLRPPSAQPRHAADRRLISAWVGLNSLVLLIILRHHGALLAVINQLNHLLLGAVFCMVLGSVTVLFHGYRRTAIASVQRQIRLIGVAWLWVALAFLLILVMPHVFNHYNLLANRALDMMTLAVPLAYFTTTLRFDLYRLDQVLVRLSIHGCAAVALVWILAGLKQLVDLPEQNMIVWYGVYALLIYPLLVRLMRRIVLRGAQSPYQHLQQTQAHFITTLNEQTLIAMTLQAIRTTFDDPAYAWYRSDLDHATCLTCTEHRGFDLPAQISDPVFVRYLQTHAAIIERQQLHHDIAPFAITDATLAMIMHPGVVLWCPLRSSAGTLLGVLLLGMRANLDPYRPQDVHHVQHFLSTAALALTNSRAYAQQHAAEDDIRTLYRQLRHVQAETAQQIARIVHDDVLNIYVRLNIQALQQLLRTHPSGPLHDELALLLASEQGISEELRLVCEQLQPTGIDDPFGFATVLRTQTDKLRTHWRGAIRVLIENQPVPLAASLQREALHITKEAIMNAIKHAAAQQIDVVVCYPPHADDRSVELLIRDDGRAAPAALVARPGHFGLRNMRESAAMVGGTLTFETTSAGTTVRLRFPIHESALHVREEYTL